ncbi:MAG: signal peptidase I, partial [Candidatus Eremiobacteraeota bacterium]|nr:signal peptidase I [Candidatus Eremiobacteraeota bacterium]
MTPLQLLALICIFAIVRVAISIRPGVPAGEGEARSSARAVVREYLDAFIVAGLVALFLITFVVRTFFIPSGSMEPTLQIHDVLLVNEFEYRFLTPKHEDIVVFPPPVDSTNDFIKRLIGAPGDSLRVHNGIVYRNDRPLVEPYISQRPN